MASTLDLASVTDALVAGLEDAVDATLLWTVNGGPTPKFTIKVSGLPPDLARGEGDTQLSLSLTHITPDSFYRNQTQRGPLGLTTQTTPIALLLTYALSAFAAKDYVHEQQAMSIALAWVAANPIQRFVVAAVPPHQIECTLTLESTSLDEIARLWQSLSGALRLTALVRVAVIFLGADPAAVVPQPKPTRVGMLVTPADLAAAGPRLLAFTEPVLIDGGKPRAALAPGQTAIVAGLALDGPERLFLSPADDSTSFDVSAWATHRTASTLHLTLPAAPGAPPGGTPAAGLYRLRLGAAPLTGTAIPVEIGP